MKTEFVIVEKSNPLAVYAICDTFESAHHWLTVLAFKYVALGYFMDKTLTVDSFEVKK